MSNSNLLKAKQEKNDEFYTRLEDIEAELSNYDPSYFKDKIIYCPTDVAVDTGRVMQSQFVRYFQINAHKLQFKKLIATCLEYGAANDDTDLNKVQNCYTLDGVTGISSYKHCPKDEEYGSGDFRSKYCLSLLEESDVVVTNPPFSLFREYIDQLMKYGKKFIIIGNPNAIIYKEFFPYIKDNKVWIGAKPWVQEMYFGVPDDQKEYLIAHKKEGSSYVLKDGEILGRIATIWFTNLDHKKRHEELILYKKYTPKEYPKYDNYDAINVDKVKDIPCDYDGMMGVPITFLDKYNKDRWEIVELLKGGKISNRNVYARIVIKRRYSFLKDEGGYPKHYTYNINEPARVVHRESVVEEFKMEVDESEFKNKKRKKSSGWDMFKDVKKVEF